MVWCWDGMLDVVSFGFDDVFMNVCKVVDMGLIFFYVDDLWG